MHFKRGFWPGSPAFYLLLLVLVLAGLLSWQVISKPKRNEKGITGAWAVEKIGSGIGVSWNFSAPLFQNAHGATLEIQDGTSERQIDLDPKQRTGIFYFSPQRENVTLRLRVKGGTEKIETIRLGPELAGELSAAAVRQPATAAVDRAASPQETSRSRLTKPPAEGAAVPDAPIAVRKVRAQAPPRWTRKLGREGLDIDVFIKIDQSGKVISANTRKYDDPVGAALAKSATDAALRWRFAPLKKTDREGVRGEVLHFKFHRT